MKAISFVVLAVVSLVVASCALDRSELRRTADATFRAILAKDYTRFRQLVEPGDMIPSESAWRDASFIRDVTPGEAIKAQWVKGPISRFTISEMEYFPGLRPAMERLVRVHFLLSGKRYVATFPIALRDNKWSPDTVPLREGNLFIGFEELNAGCVTLDSPHPSDATFQIVDVDTAAIKRHMLQGEEMQKQWQQRTLFFAPGSTWGGWGTLLMAEPKSDPDPNLGPIALTSGPTRLSYLVRNGYKKPHSLRLVFLLDFQPVPLLDLEGIQRDYYDWPELQPQVDVALTFIVPTLSRGFHQLSFLQITDPQSTSDDRTYRATQQNSFWEERFDLWVDTPTRAASVPAFENAGVGKAASRRTGTVEFVLSQTDPTNLPLGALALKPGEEKCLSLKIFQGQNESSPYTGPVPLLIEVFWNDRMSGIYNFRALPNAPTDLILKLWIKAPSEPGVYQLGAAALQFPGYSQYDSAGKERTGFYITSFSRRIMVTVAP